jgi:hypothetical protein
MLTDMDKMKIDKLVEDLPLYFLPETFLEMYREDQLDGMIRNIDVWIKDTFKDLLATK